MSKPKSIFDASAYTAAVTKHTYNAILHYLEEYANEELAQMIATKEFTNRTHNLADSYVWAVYHNGNVHGSGIAVQQADKDAWYHGRRVSGRAEAEDFLSSYKPKEDGIVVVWAACAPYGKYLDPKIGSSPTNRFYVITQEYDEVKQTLGNKFEVKITGR